MNTNTNIDTNIYVDIKSYTTENNTLCQFIKDLLNILIPVCIVFGIIAIIIYIICINFP
jgi:hypothetical protein